MREEPLDRNAKLVVPDQPVSLVWEEVEEGNFIFACHASCSICRQETPSCVTQGLPDCDADERECLYWLSMQGCRHTGAMRTYLDLLLLESPGGS